MGLTHRLVLSYPKLKNQLKVANIQKTPEQFIKSSLWKAFNVAILFSLVSILVLQKEFLSSYLSIPIFFIMFFLFFQFNFIGIKGKIHKRQREIDKEILFAGRYLLVKLHSGRPLLNSLMDASSSYGVASHHFREIVENINTGTPIEEALENAMKYAPSEKFRKILFQINNALKLGTDITGPLEYVLDDIAKEQEIEIKKYGKKLNSIVIFYLIFAVVVPSLGMTLFVVISGFLNLNLTKDIFYLLIFAVTIVQLIFISVFKSIRPMVNI